MMILTAFAQVSRSFRKVEEDFSRLNRYLELSQADYQATGPNADNEQKSSSDEDTEVGLDIHEPPLDTSSLRAT